MGRVHKYFILEVVVFEAFPFQGPNMTKINGLKITSDCEKKVGVVMVGHLLLHTDLAVAPLSLALLGILVL